jgi:hypothetical protein
MRSVFIAIILTIVELEPLLVLIAKQIENPNCRGGTGQYGMLRVCFANGSIEMRYVPQTVVTQAGSNEAMLPILEDKQMRVGGLEYSFAEFIRASVKSRSSTSRHAPCWNPNICGIQQASTQVAWGLWHHVRVAPKSFLGLHKSQKVRLAFNHRRHPEDRPDTTDRTTISIKQHASHKPATESQLVQLAAVYFNYGRYFGFQQILWASTTK